METKPLLKLRAMEIAFYKENAFKTMQKTSCVFMNDIVCVYTKV